MSHKPAIPIIHHVTGTLCSVQPTVQSGVYKQSHCMVTGDAVRCSGDLPNDVKPTVTPSNPHARTRAHTDTQCGVGHESNSSLKLIRFLSNLSNQNSAIIDSDEHACTCEEHHCLIFLLVPLSPHTCCSMGHSPLSVSFSITLMLFSCFFSPILSAFFFSSINPRWPRPWVWAVRKKDDCYWNKQTRVIKSACLSSCCPVLLSRVFLSCPRHGLWAVWSEELERKRDRIIEVWGFQSLGDWEREWVIL